MSETTTLKFRIQEDMKEAMRAKDQQRLNAIRLILASIKQYEVDKRMEAEDKIVLDILDKMVKQRKDSIEQFTKAERQELVDQEQFEVSIIQQYLPAPLTQNEIDQLISNAIAATSAKTMQDMGKVMAQVKPLIQGRADAGAVSAKIKQRLG